MPAATRTKSRAFIRDCQREWPFAAEPAAFGSYEELLESPGVDAVYIPLPTGVRKEWVLRAAAAGKHVVCEKPCAVNAADLEEMISVCRQHRVQFMDGVMFMHHPRLARVREILDDGKSVGEVRRISSAFSFYNGREFFRDNIRVNAALEPDGCLGDLGWYCIRFALWAMNWRLPREVSGRVLSQPAGKSPTEFSGELIFSGNVSAGFYCSFLAAFHQWVSVSGQKGWLRLPDFVHPFDSYRARVRGESARSPGHFRPEMPAESGPDGAGARDGAGHADVPQLCEPNFLRQAEPRLADWALKTQIVLDACRKSARRGTPVKIVNRRTAESGNDLAI